MKWLWDIFDNAMNRSREREKAISQAMAALEIDPPKPKLEPDDLWAAISINKCPDCGGEGFLEGPSGGLSTNIKCATCGHRFNVTPVIRRAERI